MTSPQRPRLVLIALLIVFGAGWGFTIPLSKIAVSGDYRHLGVIVWQLAVGVLLLGGWIVQRRDWFLLTWERFVLFAVVALVGTVIPNVASYEAARFLPAGWMSVLLSLVPMIAFPMALLLGTDSFSWARLLGLLLGLLGVCLLLLPALEHNSAAVLWVVIALIAPVMYGIEVNFVARFGLAGLNAVQVLFGASAVGLILAVPLGAWTDTLFWPAQWTGAQELAMLVAAAMHAVIYAGHVWMVGQAGSVFAAQVSYLVTAFGVVWSIILLGESYTASFWMSFVAMLGGLALVQPRRVVSSLVPQRSISEDIGSQPH